jgi:hypothetical protein
VEKRNGAGTWKMRERNKPHSKLSILLLIQSLKRKQHMQSKHSHKLFFSCPLSCLNGASCFSSSMANSEMEGAGDKYHGADGFPGSLRGREGAAGGDPQTGFLALL